MAQRLTAATSVVIVLLACWAGWSRLSVPSDGTVVMLSNAVWHQDQLRISYVLGPASGLRAGDVVERVSPGPDGTHLVTVVREGARQDLAVRLGPVPVTAFLRTTWVALLTIVSMLGIAWFVFLRRPRDPAARTLLLAASLFATGTTGWLLGDSSLRLSTAGPRPLDLVGEVGVALAWGATAHFTLVAPGTEIRASRWRAALLWALPFGLHAAYLLVVLPSAASRLEALGRISQVSLVPSVLMPPIITGLMILSYRRTPGPEARQRMRWVLIAFAVSAATLATLWTLPMLWHRPVLVEVLLPAALLPVVAALAAAILRYRLFDIEVILRRSLLYGTLTVCVLAAYLFAGSLAGRLTGGGQGLAVVLGTCLVALGIGPLRAWLQSRTGRLIYGHRDNPFGVVDRLGQVDVAASPQTVLAGVAEALAGALRLTYARIELTSGDRGPAVTAQVGEPTGDPLIVPLRHGTTPVGRLLLGAGPLQEPFGPADRRLIGALTRHLGAAAAVVLLNAELRESRQRLVLAHEDERRRIAHTLHDGLETVLTRQIGDLAGTRDRVTTDPERAAGDLDAAIAGTRAVMTDVRAVVSGLRPPALDHLGLAGAIRERAWPAGIEADDLGDLPAAVEVAAFWIVVEAARHARPPGPVRAVLRRRGDLTVVVSCAGGFRRSPALDRAAQRAADLGGSLTISWSAARARLPIREGL